MAASPLCLSASRAQGAEGQGDLPVGHGGRRHLVERYLQNTRARRQTTDRCRGLPVTATGEREGAAQDDLSLDRPRDEIARRAAFAALDAEHIRSLRATLGSCPENGRSL